MFILTNYLSSRYVDDLATIYHPERKSVLTTIKGLSLTIECLGGEVPFFYLSGKIFLFNTRFNQMNKSDPRNIGLMLKCL